MTVCIAASCENGKSIVVAADRLHTFPEYGCLTVDNTIKVSVISGNHFFMTSGTTSRGTEILDNTIARLVGESPSADDVAAAVAEEYRSLRESLIDGTVLAKYGIDSGMFREIKKANLSKSTETKVNSVRTKIKAAISSVLHREPSLAEQLIIAVGKADLEVSVILAGLTNGRAQIGKVINPGFYEVCKSAFDVIGAGENRASEFLLASRYGDGYDLPSALFAVYSAKRASESTLGVGKETDLGILRNGKAYMVPDDMKHALVEAYQKLHSTKPDLDTIVRLLK